MLQKIGFALMCIGTMFADSDKLWIPAIIVMVGLAMMILGNEERK